MQRDMDSIKRIVLEIDSWPDIWQRDLSLEGVDQPVLLRHLEYLLQAGFIEAQPHFSSLGANAAADRIAVTDLTWDGHEFLSVLKNDTAWNKIKGSFSATELAGIPLSIIKDLDIVLIKYWEKSRLGL
jgi:hypothetical protein